MLHGADMTTVEHSKNLVYYDGVQVFTDQDAGDDNDVGAMTDAVSDADGYLVVATTKESLARLYAGDVDLRTLPLEASAKAWYTALVVDDFRC